MNEFCQRLQELYYKLDNGDPRTRDNDLKGALVEGVRDNNTHRIILEYTMMKKEATFRELRSRIAEFESRQRKSYGYRQYDNKSQNQNLSSSYPRQNTREFVNSNSKPRSLYHDTQKKGNNHDTANQGKDKENTTGKVRRVAAKPSGKVIPTTQKAKLIKKTRNLSSWHARPWEKRKETRKPLSGNVQKHQ